MRVADTNWMQIERYLAELWAVGVEETRDQLERAWPSLS